jgi:predicted small lipoprotein YifL
MSGLRFPLVLALLWSAAGCGGAAPTNAPVVEPAAQPTEQPGETPPAAESVGTGSALGESTEPPAGHIAPDAGARPDKAPDAKPKK